MDSLFSPTSLKQLCQQYGLSPSKAYGQNYLISGKPIQEMIASGELEKDDTVVEVGPGFGVLTLAIASLVKKVVAFEIEKKIQPYWKERQKEYPNIEIVWGNFVRNWELRNNETAPDRGWGFASRLKKLRDYKVMANLPYHITSQVLRLLLETEPKPERIIVMVQKEVAERICAKPGDMSLLSVSVQYYGEPKIVTKVPRGSFWPVPKVDSAVVQIRTHQHTSRSERRQGVLDEEFFTIVRAGFAHPRKQLWKNLAEQFIDIDWKKVLLDIMENDKVRAEELSVEQWRKVCDVQLAMNKLNPANC